MSAFVSRIRFDVYGASASEVSDGLHNAANSVPQQNSCAGFPSYGETVIERCLETPDGENYSWKGRLSVCPEIGCEPFVPVTNLRNALA